jgi:hypothetical protein
MGPAPFTVVKGGDSEREHLTLNPAGGLSFASFAKGGDSATDSERF